MSLHHDFPYMTKKLYCKTCKTITLHTQDFNDFKCAICGKKWDDLLIRVNMRQNQYGKTQYDGTILSEKPANARDYVTKTFDSLDSCIEWLREKATAVQEEIKS